MNLYGAALLRNHPNTVSQTRSFFASFAQKESVEKERYVGAKLAKDRKARNADPPP